MQANQKARERKELLRKSAITGKPGDPHAQTLSLGPVLVVDDDEFVCTLISRQLKQIGVTDVTALCDATAAAKLMRQDRQFSLIICDLRMPGVDGIQLLRDIAAHQARTPVLLITVLDRKVLTAAEELGSARGLRILGGLRKPVSIKDLRTFLALAEQAPAAVVKNDLPSPTADELRQAIVNRDIKIHVQPKMRASDGTLVGVEALARWHLSSRGWVSPDHFIPLAVRFGLIDQLTDLVLRQSLAACGRWRRAGLETNIAVNAPISCMVDLKLPEWISEVCAEYGVNPKQLTIEITESGLTDDDAGALDVLTRLRLRGVELAMDDFGSGYSTLRQLRRLPFTELKLDRSFVLASLNDDHARSIVESAARLSGELGLRCVAEGVETMQHWQLMADLGFTAVQGFVISPAFPASELPQWLAQYPGRRR